MLMTGEPWLRQAFGLCLRSVVPLPELLPAAPGTPVDVDIVIGEVPEDLTGVVKRGVRFTAAPGNLRLQVDGIASYLIEGGRRIVIAPAAAASDEDVRVFLLGSAMGALLHQRGDLVLHGSAIGWNGEAVVFLGRSGVGKSTLAAAFRRRGYPILTDDLCIVRPDANGRMCAFPGFPQAKLWLDSLRMLDVAPDSLRRVRQELDKRVVPLTDVEQPPPLPVRHLYVLNDHNTDQFELNELPGAHRFRALKNQTYRFAFLAGADARTSHFQHALGLARQASIGAVKRPKGSFRLDDLVQLIEEDLRR
jgi:hypothetical protein